MSPVLIGDTSSNGCVHIVMLVFRGVDVSPLNKGEFDGHIYLSKKDMCLVDHFEEMP